MSQFVENVVAMSSGELVVFEGPDGAGKSELAAHFQRWLVGQGFAAEVQSFPGREPGTLGKLVYELHSDPEKFHVSELTPASLQALHIAAHLDAIERRIVPSLISNRTVVLDRFWWSTYVYGIASDVDREVLDRMIATENAAWGATKPTLLFLIDRSEPLRPESLDFWRTCKDLYRELLATERTQYLCETIVNDGDIEQTLELLIKSWQKRPR